jgi:CheY-like chemotaxis protein/HPt (histidine-containing phosphotransfer) domain-containing protein
MAPVDFPKGLRILLAEDLEINQDIAVASLASGEPEVDVVANGMEAVQAAAERDYDIILMDIQMPGMDGIAATKEIRKLPGRKGHVPVIAMTANVLPHQIERIRNAGLNDHVGKPFDKRELFRIIARWALEPAVVDVEGQCTDEGEVAPNHSQYEPDNELEVLQLDVLQDFIRTLGESKTKRSVLSLRELVETIEAFAELPEKPNDQILQTAHKIVSTAGLLGFLHLSQVARDLQDACRSGANIDEALQKFGKIGSLSKIRMRDLEDDVGFRT